MKKLTLFTSVFVLSVSFQLTNPLFALAQEEEASDTPASDEAVQQNIKDRLKKVVDEKKDQIKGVANDNKRGFVAQVKRVSEETLTVESRQGTQIIPLDSNVVVVQDGKAFKIADIEVDSQVVVIGYQTNNDFEARRILVQKKPLQTQKKLVVTGKIKTIAKTSFVLSASNNEEKTFAFTTKTPFEDSQSEVLKSSDLDVGQELLIITAEDGAIIRAKVTSKISEEKATTPVPTAKSAVKVTPKSTTAPKATTTPKAE